MRARRSRREDGAAFRFACSIAISITFPTYSRARDCSQAIRDEVRGAYASAAAEPKIIGGTKADPADWPSTFVFESADGGGCTSTLVGERVAAITAAHCVADGGSGTLINHSQQIAVACHRHPVYRHFEVDDPSKREQTSPDFALCVMQEPVPGGAFERIDSKGTDIVKNRKVHLLGFGCTETGGSDGVSACSMKVVRTSQRCRLRQKITTRRRGSARRLLGRQRRWRLPAPQRRQDPARARRYQLPWQPLPPRRSCPRPTSPVFCHGPANGRTPSN